MRCVVRRTAVASLVAAACQSTPPVPAPPAQRRTAALPAAEIVACIDLPRDDPRSHDLSGLAWDPVARQLFAVSDHRPSVTVMVPRPGFTGVDLAPPIALDIAIERSEREGGDPDGSARRGIHPWDGEALALAGDRFLIVANETLAAVFSVDRTGRGAVPIDLPALPGIRSNAGLESLGYVASPGGRYLFVVNEQALAGDGDVSTAAHGTVVRIVRRALDGGGDREVAYLTDPVFSAGLGDNGVSDIAALSPDRLLVLERGFVYGAGNAARVYDVDLRGAADITALADARAAVPAAKRLVFDLAALPDAPCSTPPGAQRRKSLDNYEGLAIGPTLDDGRPLVLLISDDNHNANQLARLVVVAIAPDRL